MAAPAAATCRFIVHQFHHLDPKQLEAQYAQEEMRVANAVPHDVLPGDRIVVDGPGAFQDSRAAQRELDAEIATAGGFDNWPAAAERYRRGLLRFACERPSANLTQPA